VCFSACGCALIRRVLSYMCIWVGAKVRLLRGVLANMCVCLKFVLRLECLGVCLLRFFCDSDFAFRCVFSLVLLCLDVYVKM
jgi:hypothetical protein